ncbi:hypothetical protein scyTo_0011336 [Scyliorhinus torazame]|uniref:Chemokine interleukin-8-like domain-containing protein n=1 Tax=Scyliorhinus torazame TaxID=75743 RepID=A0A401NKY0_SCYTO|nr:hypothetical protein [Scyliorhinus torazame]
MKQLLVVLICFNVFISLLAVDGTSKANCCLKFSKKIPALKNIQDYKKVDSRCKDAVLFMVRGHWICLAPSKKVKKRAQTFSLKKITP